MGSQRRVRALAASIATLLAANTVVVAGSLHAKAPDGVASAAVALASTAEPAPQAERESFVLDIPVPQAIDPTVELPVPEPAPANPYAATPEIEHGLLEIPAIGLAQPLFEGVTLTAINRGPSHWPGTAMPGEVGNVVVAGHRTTYSRPFWSLNELVPGDELVFTMANGERHVYELDSLEVVYPSDVHIVEQTRARTATLFGCHPRGSARQRIVAHFRMKPATVPVEVYDLPGLSVPMGGSL